ncbi:MAG TPA: hypothetical protein V6C82_00455, partial [Chroococcales cyanobacterium]
ASASATASVPASPTPKPSGTPSFETNSDDKGHFETKDAPEGSFILLLTAPNYQAVTLYGIRSGELEIALTPFKGPTEVPLNGVVKLTSQKPAVGSRIATTFLPGLTSGDAAECDKAGEFKMNVASLGKVSLAAMVVRDGEINAFSYLPDVPTDTKTAAHALVLRAVAKPIILAGDSGENKKEGKEAKEDLALSPQRAQVFLADGNGEIPLLTRAVRNSRFRVSLPQPPEDASYHLALSAKSEAGDVSFIHFYKQTDSNLKLTASLLPFPTAQFDGHSFRWEAVPDATFFRVRVEESIEGKDSGRILWEGFTNGTRIDLPELSLLSLLDKKKDYKFSLTAVKVEGSKEWTSTLNGPWAASSSQAPTDLIFSSEEPPVKKNKN